MTPFTVWKKVSKLLVKVPPISMLSNAGESKYANILVKWIGFFVDFLITPPVIIIILKQKKTFRK